MKAPPIARKLLQIVTPEQFDDVYNALPEGTFRLLVETEIESGLRWGELSELRPKDLNLKTRILTVSRTVVELNPKFHPEGGHFLVKDYPKDKEYRRFKLSAQMTGKLEEHIRAACLTRDDLFFHMPPQDQPRVRITEIPDPDTLGRTEPNERDAPTTTAPSASTPPAGAAAANAAEPSSSTEPPAAPRAKTTRALFARA